MPNVRYQELTDIGIQDPSSSVSGTHHSLFANQSFTTHRNELEVARLKWKDNVKYWNAKGGVLCGWLAVCSRSRLCGVGCKLQKREVAASGLMIIVVITM
ncbi:MAG: hypothetical protein J0648_05155 [Pelodictyon phaeoclathratiforme]|nr:hypothetical protein [Pelodictyon phaeoclathratiforme]